MGKICDKSENGHHGYELWPLMTSIETKPEAPPVVEPTTPVSPVSPAPPASPQPEGGQRRSRKASPKGTKKKTKRKKGKLSLMCGGFEQSGQPFPSLPHNLYITCL